MSTKAKPKAKESDWDFDMVKRHLDAMRWRLDGITREIRSMQAGMRKAGTPLAKPDGSIPMQPAPIRPLAKAKPRQ